MRKLIFYILSISMLSSCSQEVDHPIADYCWPVVHSFINFEDSVHYLRLGKTFSGSHLEEMINNPDSLYFKEADVYFDFYNDDYITKTIKLELTNDFEREPGIFPASPVPFYKTDYNIQPGKVGLRIALPEIDQYVAATFRVRGKPRFYSPDPKGYKELDLYGEYPLKISWDGTGISITTIRLWYLEISEYRKDTCKLDWTRFDSDFILLPEDWFDYMLYWIKDDYRVLGRRVIGIDILARAEIAYNTSTGQAFDLIGKPFSNLTGAHGYVGSWATGGTYGYMPDRKFLDTLSNNARLKRLKFIYN